MKKLNVLKRTAERKSEINKIRREGNIPAVIYQRGKNAEPFAIKGNEFSSILRNVQPGRLPTTVFTLVDEKGKERRAVLKDIQYNITNYNVIHLDFEELKDDMPINVKVPIECTGAADCVGVKLGGQVRQVIRYMRIRCLPKDMPEVFYLDVKDLGLNQSRRLSDLAIKESIRPLADLKEVAVVVVRR